MKYLIHSMVLALFISLVGTTTLFANDRYDNFERYPIGDGFDLSSRAVLTFSDSDTVTMGDNYTFKAKVSAGSTDIVHAEIRVYEYDSSLSKREMPGCHDYDVSDAEPIVTFDIPTVAAGTVYTSGELRVPVTPEHFAVLEDGAELELTGSSLIVDFYSPTGQFDELECGGQGIDTLHVMENEPTIDLAIHDVQVRPSTVAEGGTATITVDVVNNGSTTYTATNDGIVSISKADFSATPSFGISQDFDVSAGKKINDLSPGEHQFFTFTIDSTKPLFPWDHSVNHRLSKGVNRMLATVSVPSGVHQISTSNDDAAFSITYVDALERTSTTDSTTVGPRAITSERIVKSPVHPSVYWVKNGKRHPFVSRAVYATWFTSFDRLENLTADQVEAIPLGNPVSVKPGVALIKFPYNPKVYSVVEEGLITHIPSAAAAAREYGADWERKIIQLPEIYYLFYTVR